MELQSGGAYIPLPPNYAPILIWFASGTLHNSISSIIKQVAARHK